MSIYVELVHIILAIILFYLVNWIGNHTRPLDLGYVNISVTIHDDTAPLFNYFFKVLAPVIYLIFLITFFQIVGWGALNKNIYLIVVYYWIYRFAYISFRGQLPLLNWWLQITYWISSIGLAVWVYLIVDKLKTILPDPTSLLEELWILIILFVYSVFNKMGFSRKGAETRIEKYVDKQYLQFKNKYGEIVESLINQDCFEVLVYSIMIYENFNRPRHARFIERIYGSFSHKQHTYGIMQVMSQVPLSDEESVRQAIAKICRDAQIVLATNYEEDDKIFVSGLIRLTLDKYNPGDPSYESEVMQVYYLLMKKYYPEFPNYLSRDNILFCRTC